MSDATKKALSKPSVSINVSLANVDSAVSFSLVELQAMVVMLLYWSILNKILNNKYQKIINSDTK